MAVDPIDIAFIAKSCALDNDAVLAASPSAGIVPVATIDDGAVPAAPPSAGVIPAATFDDGTVPAAPPSAGIIRVATIDGGAIPVPVLAASAVFLDSDAIADAASSEAVFLDATVVDKEIPRR